LKSFVVFGNAENSFSNTEHYFFPFLLNSNEIITPKTATKTSIATTTRSGDGSVVILACKTCIIGISAKTEKISRAAILCIYFNILSGFTLQLKDLLSRFLY